MVFHGFVNITVKKRFLNHIFTVMISKTINVYKLLI